MGKGIEEKFLKEIKCNIIRKSKIKIQSLKWDKEFFLISYSSLPKYTLIVMHQTL